MSTTCNTMTPIAVTQARHAASSIIARTLFGPERENDTSARYAAKCVVEASGLGDLLSELYDVAHKEGAAQVSQRVNQ